MRALCDSTPGSTDKDDPFICVDDVANPPVVRIKELKVHDRQGPEKVHPVMIRWYTRSKSKDLVVRFSDDNPCVEQPVCFKQGGFCRTVTKKVATDMPCSYTVTVNGAPIDPVIIVQPCCAYMEGLTPELIP